MGPRCAILSDEGSQASGLEPECTVCAQPWPSHPKGKQINKDCKFRQQQAPRDIAPDDIEPPENIDIQARFSRLTQENLAIKAQLNQLADLVQQLLSQQLPTAQTAQPSSRTNNSDSELLTSEEQFPSSHTPSLSLPHPSWPQLRETVPGESSSNQLASYPGPALQSSAPEARVSLLTASASGPALQEGPSLHHSLPHNPSILPHAAQGQHM